jgi:hypothetical protein
MHGSSLIPPPLSPTASPIGIGMVEDNALLRKGMRQAVARGLGRGLEGGE